MNKQYKILHITAHLGGGVGKVVTNYLKKSKTHSKFTHSVASLDYINEEAKEILNDIKIDYNDNLHLDIPKLMLEYEEIEEKEETAEAKTGLWENIRKKKKRMGKNYKPAKPGSKDRPSKKAWEKAQSADEEKDFKPHMMYDPKTGKAVEAKTYKDHLALKEKGYTHEKPNKEKK